jgi:hypothetical protein
MRLSTFLAMRTPALLHAAFKRARLAARLRPREDKGESVLTPEARAQPT